MIGGRGLTHMRGKVPALTELKTKFYLRQIAVRLACGRSLGWGFVVCRFGWFADHKIGPFRSLFPFPPSHQELI